MINLNTEEFRLKDCVIGNDECVLITPTDMGTKWTDANAHFRSCILRKSDNKIVSLGLKKFVNWGEKPEFQPWNNDWSFDAFHKIDGSLLIISKYKGELIVRTRGTTNARNLENGHEIDILIKKYPKVFDNIYLDKEEWSIHCEWTTPSNIIVIREHDEPTLTLIGMVNHNTLQYVDQEFLDAAAKSWNIGRPQKYKYNSVAECIADVSLWEGKEGVVIYSPDGQTLKKIKSEQYLSLHSIATGMCGISKVLDVFLASPKFTVYEDFYNYVETTIDHEVAEKIKDEMRQIVEAYNLYLHHYTSAVYEIENYISHMDGRREQALEIQNKWKNIPWLIPLAFNILDNKPITDKLLMKTLEKILS